MYSFSIARILPLHPYPPYSTVRLRTTIVTITEPAISMEHFESPVEENNEVPTRSKRQRTAKSFGDDFLVYLIDDTPSSISEAYASEDADY